MRRKIEKIEPGDTIQDVARKAAAAGMTYGAYVAMSYSPPPSMRLNRTNTTKAKKQEEKTNG